MADNVHVFRLEGDVTLAGAVDGIDDCLNKAVADGARRVLIDIRGLGGFSRPGLLERLVMVRRWAASSKGRIKVALVSRGELIDSERFGVVLARGMGFDGNVFELEDEARHWLDQTPSLWTGQPPEF